MELGTGNLKQGILIPKFRQKNMIQKKSMLINIYHRIFENSDKNIPHTKI
jgi:hypothetical protein